MCEFIRMGGDIIQDLWKRGIDFIYPRRCPICGDIVVPKTDKACPNCKKLLEIIIEPKCKKCGKSIEYMELEFCFDCTKKEYHFEKGYSLWNYNKIMKRSMAAFKYGGKREYAAFYGEEFVKEYGDKICSLKPQVLIPVPIHKSKKRNRGYNQAEVIAKEIGEKLHIPVLTNLLVRSKKTLPQKDLNEKERLKNLEQAFMVPEERKELCRKLKKVVIVDDIYTTGSTIEACAKMLHKVGVEEVYFSVLCIGKGF